MFLALMMMMLYGEGGGDLNCDGKVDLLDYGYVQVWQNRPTVERRRCLRIGCGEKFHYLTDSEIENYAVRFRATTPCGSFTFDDQPGVDGGYHLNVPDGVSWSVFLDTNEWSIKLNTEAGV
jgi:hypothetical protein